MYGVYGDRSAKERQAADLMLCPPGLDRVEHVLGSLRAVLGNVYQGFDVLACDLGVAGEDGLLCLGRDFRYGIYSLSKGSVVLDSPDSNLVLFCQLRISFQ